MNSPNVPDVSPDIPSRGWQLTLAALKRLPQAALSKSFGALADIPVPARLRRIVISGFAHALGIDTSEAELPIEEYGSLNDFFVRKLKPGARRWPSSDTEIASPVEAVVGQSGLIQAGSLLQAKGRSYTVRRLLDDAQEAERFNGGSYVTFYLSPRHYHRIHAPAAGLINQARHIPGQLLPVNAAAVMHVPELFATNERIVCYLDAKAGRIAVVAIGAYNVGRISTAFEKTWPKKRQPETRTYKPPVKVSQGDEIMAFHLGSSVVMLLEPGVRLSPSLVAGAEVLLGATVATT